MKAPREQGNFWQAQTSPPTGRALQVMWLIRVARVDRHACVHQCSLSCFFVSVGAGLHDRKTERHRHNSRKVETKHSPNRGDFCVQSGYRDLRALSEEPKQVLVTATLRSVSICSGHYAAFSTGGTCRFDRVGALNLGSLKSGCLLLYVVRFAK